MANFMKPSQSSYLDYIVNNSRPGPDLCAADTIFAIKGTCNSMCPEEEIILRKKERMVHVLEAIGDKQKLVKCYCRPAADMNLAVAQNLRPFHVLRETVNYLLFEVTKRKDMSKLVVYNFVADRLRAVRQDMIIQNLDSELCIILVEPMIRFHVYYGYLLCEEPINDYSPTLNQNILLECLKTCLCCYDDLELTNALKSRDMSLLINDLLNCNLEESGGEQLGQSRDLMEALYVLTILYHESPMWRLRGLSENVRHAPPVRLAYRLASAALRGHYATVCKALPNLCPLMLCAVALLLPTLQRRGLQVLCVAYSCRGRGVPLAAVRAWLGVADDAATRTLRHYGLTVTNGLVECARGCFRDDAPILPPRKIMAEHLEGKMNMEYILTYTPRDT